MSPTRVGQGYEVVSASDIDPWGRVVAALTVVNGIEMASKLDIDFTRLGDLERNCPLDIDDLDQLVAYLD
jgi:hypothetical protein